MSMTKQERHELQQLIKKREKVMKAKATERSAELLAEFEELSQSVYKFDDDATWEAAAREAKAVADKANETIAKRCKQLGIPKQFAPQLSLQWLERGRNMFAAERAEMRAAAKARIAAIEKAACSQIETLALEAMTAVVTSGVTSIAAKNFMEQMGDLNKLMPALDVKDVQTMIDKKRGERDKRFAAHGGHLIERDWSQ